MESSVIAALDELIVDMTNVIRKSEAAHHLFLGSDKAEQMFDTWQDTLLKSAHIAMTSWTRNDDFCENALEIFRTALEAALPRASHLKHTL